MYLLPQSCLRRSPRQCATVRPPRRAELPPNTMAAAVATTSADVHAPTTTPPRCFVDTPYPLDRKDHSRLRLRQRHQESALGTVAAPSVLTGRIRWVAPLRASRTIARMGIVFWATAALIFVTFSAVSPASAVRRDWPATGWTNPTSTAFEDWGFGSCSPPYDGNYAHLGADSHLAPAGRAVVAMAAGTVIGKVTGWPGDALGIQHQAGDGTRFVAIYGHINSTVSVGSTVAPGQGIGTVLNQGSNSHLHLGIRPLATGETASVAMIKGRSSCSAFQTYGLVDPLPWLATHSLVAVSPFGSFDEASSPGAGVLRVAGWSADPDAPTQSIDVHVYINDTFLWGATANQRRDDVAAAYPGYGVVTASLRIRPCPRVVRTRCARSGSTSAVGPTSPCGTASRFKLLTRSPSGFSTRCPPRPRGQSRCRVGRLIRAIRVPASRSTPTWTRGSWGRLRLTTVAMMLTEP